MKSIPAQQLEIKHDTITRQKLESIMRFDSGFQPYKYRDIRDQMWYGIPAYKNFTKKEINDIFKLQELKITKADKEWSTY